MITNGYGLVYHQVRRLTISSSFSA